MTDEPKPKWSPEEQAEIDRVIAESQAKTDALIAKSKRLIEQGEALKQRVKNEVIAPNLAALAVTQALQAYLDWLESQDGT